MSRDRSPNWSLFKIPRDDASSTIAMEIPRCRVECFTTNRNLPRCRWLLHKPPHPPHTFQYSIIRAPGPAPPPLKGSFLERRRLRPAMTFNAQNRPFRACSCPPAHFKSSSRLGPACALGEKLSRVLEPVHRGVLLFRYMRLQPIHTHTFATTDTCSDTRACARSHSVLGQHSFGCFAYYSSHVK